MSVYHMRKNGYEVERSSDDFPSSWPNSSKRSGCVPALGFYETPLILIIICVYF